jgi:hypothetical protein
MDAAKASETALVAAFFRAYHHKHDDPKIFEAARGVGDPFLTGFDPDEQQRRYFGGRSDGSRATGNTRFACASMR